MRKLKTVLAYVVMVGYLIATALLFTSSLPHADVVLWDLLIFLIVVCLVGFLAYEREDDSPRKKN